MRDLPNLLFSQDDLDGFLRQNSLRAAQAVDGIPERQFLNASTDEVVEHVHALHEIDPIELHEDQKELNPEEVQVDVSGDRSRFFADERGPFYVRGTRVTVTIPFTGNPELWNYRTSTFNTCPPRADIRTLSGGNSCGFLDIRRDYPMDVIGDGTRISEEVNGILGNIQWYLQQSRGQVLGHNDNLRNQIRQAVEGRRARLGKQAEIAKALNMPLKQKPGTPDVTQLTIKKRIVKSLPTKPNVPAEPAISDQEYENILRIIRHEGRTFETTPATYAIHDEEGLRDIMVAHLNGHYEGDASGETFRRAGKTDIRIEDKSRAAFVAECKVWRGPKEITEAVAQLLSYLTWRDCKAALVIFNQQVAEFAGIQAKLPEVLSGHPQFLSKVSVAEVGESRFKLRSADDPDRIVTVHVFLFNLYVARKPAKKTGAK